MAQPEEEKRPGIVVIGIRKIVGVVEVEVVIVRLEVEGTVGGLPRICLFPSKSTGKIAFMKIIFFLHFIWLPYQRRSAHLAKTLEKDK